MIGDGQSSIEQLVDRENLARLEEKPITSFNELTLDLEADFTLEDQNVDLNSVPKNEEMVIVKRVTNQNARRDQRGVTDQVHSDYDKLATELHDTLGFRLIGIDVISRNIHMSPLSGNGVVNEVNIPPGLHYHELVADRTDLTNVGPLLLKAALKQV